MKIIQVELKFPFLLSPVTCEWENITSRHAQSRTFVRCANQSAKERKFLIKIPMLRGTEK